MAIDRTERSAIGEGRQSSFEYLVTAAASVAQMAIRQGASVRLTGSDALDPADFAGRGAEHLFMILTSLARTDPDQSASLGTTMVERIGVVAPGTTLVLLTAHPDDALPGAIAHYTAAGVQTHVFFADPASFNGPASRVTSDRTEQFLGKLAAAQATVFVLRRNEERRIQPEYLQNANLNK
jgi:uncharacterized protein (DUF58 family)